MNESTEWLQITIITKVPFYLHTHRQTDHSARHRVRTQTQRAPRAAAAPLRAKGKNWGHWWGERGRQAGRERGREEGRAQRGEGVGISGGPRRWVVRWAALPRSCCLFRACVCACGQYYYPMSFAQNLSPAPTHEWSANKLVCTHPRNFLFKFLRQKQNCWGENSLQTHTHPPSFQWVSTKLTSRAGWFCSTK
jgi:hypothetical protein